ncbi:MAG: cytochrome c, partial [Thermodesulfobacteriota bacterium]
MKKCVSLILALMLVAGVCFTAQASDVSNGGKIFNKYCAKCHGKDGSVSEYGRSMKERQARDLRTNRLFIAPKELLSIIKYG